MPLGSFEYLLFLGVGAAVFHALKGRGQVAWLLLLSLFFYGSLFKPAWLAALAGVALGSWWLGLKIQSESRESRRLAWLWVGVLAALGLLGWIKYSGMAAQAINALVAALGKTYALPVLQPLLFLGISYYVFQAISYLCDIYFRSIPAEADLGKLALYFAFFPKVVQGPIERAGDLLPQLGQAYRFDAKVLEAGLWRILGGLFKKAILAEQLGVFVDRAFNGQAHSAPALAVGAVLFCAQLYLDFSGYTDIALGSASLFNLRLSENFDQPYKAVSMKDFWRRWHLSLSRFILDYLFQPLQVLWRDYGNLGAAAAIFTSFFLMGVWHGPQWTYAVFGLLQGLFMASALLYRPWQKKLHKTRFFAGAAWVPAWQRAFTLGLVILSFALVRLPSLSQAADYYRGLLGPWSLGGLEIYADGPAWALMAASAALYALFRGRPAARVLAPLALTWLLYFGRFYAQRGFIYAQF